VIAVAGPNSAIDTLLELAIDEVGEGLLGGESSPGLLSILGEHMTAQELIEGKNTLDARGLQWVFTSVGHLGLATWVPAQRAPSADPLTLLRQE
jgi:hypothetical protein